MDEMRQRGLYKNRWGQKVQIPYADMDCGEATFSYPDYKIRIDFWGDGDKVEEWELSETHFVYAFNDIMGFLHGRK